MNGGWIQILVVVIFIGAPILKQIGDHLQRKKEAREIEQDRDRREIDALRTGSKAPKPAPQSARAAQFQQTGQVNAANRLREIQEKRREALEQARRHAIAAVGISVGTQIGNQPARARPTQGVRPIPAAPRPIQPAARQIAPSPLIGGRAPLPSRQMAQAAPVQRQPRQRQQTVAAPLKPLHAAPVKRKRATHARQGDHSTVHRLVANAEKGAVIEKSHATVSPREFARMDRKAWQKAFVMQELMSPPVAFRDD